MMVSPKLYSSTTHSPATRTSSDCVSVDRISSFLRKCAQVARASRLSSVPTVSSNLARLSEKMSAFAVSTTVVILTTSSSRMLRSPKKLYSCRMPRIRLSFITSSLPRATM